MAYFGFDLWKSENNKNAFRGNYLANPKIVFVFLILCQFLFAEDLKENPDLQWQPTSWCLSLSRSGYFGNFSLGIVHQTESRNIFEFSIGGYSVDGTHYGQMNFAYRYAFWSVYRNNKRIQPFSMGLFMINSQDGNTFFYESPDKYPSPGYYDQTRFRWGFEFGSSITVNQQYGIAYFFRIIDSGAVAAFNNRSKSLQYYISSGLSLLYRFQ